MILDIIIGWFRKRPMKKKLSYDEIVDHIYNCGIELSEKYEYKGNIYQVSDITLVAGIDNIKFQVVYYPLDNLLVRFSRDLEDFKSKFKIN